MATIGEHYDALNAADADQAAKAGALSEAEDAYAASRAALEARKGEFRDAIRDRPDPTKLIVLEGPGGQLLVVVPDDSEDGYRAVEADSAKSDHGPSGPAGPAPA